MRCEGMNTDDKILKFNSNREANNKYELLKAMLSNKERVNHHKRSLGFALLGLIIFILLASGLYLRSQLGHKPASIDEVLTQEHCPIVGNVDSKLYHLPKERHYLELLQSNKARENRICFNKEWEATLAGYRKSKL
jgi:hypothetical protein